MSETSTRKKLSLLDAVNIIIGSMIGSGIFLVTADIATQVQTPMLVILAWVVTALFVILGALTYGELGGMMPQAGGLYVYLKESFGKMTGFLYGWSFFTAIQCGSLAAVAVAFAKFTGVFFPFISAENVLVPLNFGALGAYPITTQNLLSILCLIALTVTNLQPVKTGAIVQNVFTFAKVGALVLVIGLGLIFGLGGQGSVENFAAPEGFVTKSESFTDTLFVLFGAALVGSIFAASAWEYVTFTAGEMINPKRNLPRALLLGTGLVSLIYISCNVVYLYILPIGEIQAVPEGRVGTLLMERLLGTPGQSFMAILIMISTFGCLNGLTLGGARVTYAMAKDGLFFKQAGKLNKHDSPAWVLWAQCIWSSLLCLSGSYGQLLDFTVFVMVVFYLLPAVGVFFLRTSQPDAERPYKVWGYPFVPILFIALCLYISIATIITRPNYAGFGLILVLIGVPIYYYFKSTQHRTLGGS